MTCNKIKNYIGYKRNKYEMSPLKKSKFVKQITSSRVHENHDMSIEKININYRYTLLKLQADTTQLEIESQPPRIKNKTQNFSGFGEGKGNI